MSATYYWRPIVPPPPPGGDIDLGLWHLLKERQAFGWEPGDGIVLDQSDVPYLEGVRDVLSMNDPIANDASKLIGALKKYEQVLLSYNY